MYPFAERFASYTRSVCAVSYVNRTSTVRAAGYASALSFFAELFHIHGGVDILFIRSSSEKEEQHNGTEPNKHLLL